MKIRIMTECIMGLGLGHVARSYNLALFFLDMGYKVDFFVRGNADFCNFLQKQNAQKYQYFYPLRIEWKDIRNVDFLESDICILDTYEVNDFSFFMRHTGVLVLFDDDGRHLDFLRDMQYISLESNTAHTNHSCDICLYDVEGNDKNDVKEEFRAKLFLLNPNGLYNTFNLQSEVKQRVFSGLEYALLHPCFRESALKNKAKKYDFFLCFGGEDLQDISFSLFMQLLYLKKRVAVVVGANYKGKLLESSLLHKDTIGAKNGDFLYELNNEQSVFYNIPQEQIAYLMASSSICIVSGGGILFEALALCNRVFALNLASNQSEQIRVLSNQGIVNEVTLPIDFESLQECVATNNKQIQDIQSFKEGCSEALQSLNVHVGSLVGEFTSHLIFECINCRLHSHKMEKKNDFLLNTSFHTLFAVDFCNLSSKEASDILQYRNHPIVRENMYGNDIISAKTHADFLESLHCNNYSRYFLVKDLEVHIGVISFSKINLKHRHAYFGIYKNPFLSSQAKQVSASLGEGRDIMADKRHIQKKKKSYGSLLMDMVKHIAFRQYSLHMIYLEVVAYNAHAIAFYEREGFSFFGRLENGFRVYKDSCEQFYDVYVYGMQNPFIK